MRRLMSFVPVNILRLVAALVFTGYALFAAGIDVKGVIAGRVLDSSGAVLQGAQVQLQPGGLALASDAQGEFAITDLAPGAYKLQVSYVGFAPFETDVAVTAGEINHVEARMTVHSQSEQILVTADRPHAEAESINRTRMADNILQVLPAEVITSLPNANVADALGRLPSVTLERIEGEGVYVQVRGTEPRLTNVTINGITVPSPSLTFATFASTPFPPTSSSPSRSIRPSLPTWMATALAVP